MISRLTPTQMKSSFPPLKIAPSILSADLGKLNHEVKSVEKFSDLIHFDVMDGQFVHNISIGPCVLKCLKTRLPVDCHLMIENPIQYIDEFAEAGASLISVHFEACSKNLKNVINKIKSYKMKASVAIKPKTLATVLDPFLHLLDMVLVMSVEPGFSGQKFMPVCLDKINYLREKCPNLEIEVDGGISDKTAPKVKKAGANVLVSASYIFNSKDRRKAIEKLRN